MGNFLTTEEQQISRIVNVRYSSNITTISGKTDLIVACLYGNLEDVMRTCLRNPLMLNDYDIDGNTALFHCIKNSYFDKQSFLMMQKVDFNHQNKNGENILTLLYQQIQRVNDKNPNTNILIISTLSELVIQKKIVQLGELRSLLTGETQLPGTRKSNNPLTRCKIPTYPRYYHVSKNLLYAILNDNISMFQDEVNIYSCDKFEFACAYDAVGIIDMFLDSNFIMPSILSLQLLTYFNNADILIKILNLSGNYINTYTIDEISDLETYTTSNDVKTVIQMFVQRILEVNQKKEEQARITLGYNPEHQSLNVGRLSISDRIGNAIGFSKTVKENLKLTRQISNVNIRIYSRDDFEYVKNESTIEGGFGAVSHIRDSDGLDLIIKKYKNCPGDYRFLDSTTTKEIAFLLMVNRLKPGISAKLHGLFFDGSCIYLILEYLPYTLSDFLLKSKPKTPAFLANFFKIILESLLDIVNELNSTGICHCDIKDINIMLDKNGKMKLIDFGLSEFLGIAPPSYYRQVRGGTLSTAAPDGKVSGRRNPLPYNPFKFGDYKNSVKTLNFDVFSIGCILLNEIFGTKSYRYISDGICLIVYPPQVSLRRNLGTPYYLLVKIKLGDKESMTRRSIEPLYRFGNQFADLILRMVHINSDCRPFAKQCLDDIYFSGKRNTSINVEPFVTSLLFDNYEFYQKSNILELRYADEILISTGNLILRGSQNHYGNNVFKFIIRQTIEISKNIDVVLNSISKTLISLNGDVSNEDTIFKHIIANTTICQYIFENSSTYNNRYFDSRNSEVTAIFGQIITKPETFEICPIRTQIMYIIVESQKIGISVDLLRDAINIVTDRILKFILSIHPDFPIRTLIAHIFLKYAELADSLPIFRDVEINEQINRLLENTENGYDFSMTFKCEFME